jgi:small nuclear ribonucleoprotein (snRNP)-like protein
VAFDKYLNLLLRDVEEAYTVIVKVQRVKQQVVQQPQLLQAQGVAKQEQGQQQQQQLDQQLRLDPQQQQQQAQRQQQQTQQQQEHQQQAPQAPSTRTRTRWCRKQQHRFREMDQILLRGDNIVLVSGSPPPLSLQPAGLGPDNAQAM